MPKIYFKGAEYNRAEDMPADIRAEYDKAVRMLPDRDANGIPDLLEVDNQPEDQAAPLAASTVTSPKAARAANKAIRAASWITVGVIGLIVVCVVVIIIGAAALMKSSGAYQLGVDTALANSTVQDVLGTPLKTGFFVTGSISESGASGSAELSVPLSGSRQSGTLAVIATKEEDTWRLESLTLEVGGQTYQIH